MRSGERTEIYKGGSGARQGVRRENCGDRSAEESWERCGGIKMSEQSVLLLRKQLAGNVLRGVRWQLMACLCFTIV